MPYVVAAERTRNVFQCLTSGQLNYQLTLVLLESFKENPKYETIHVLKRDFVTFPKDNQFLQKLRPMLAQYFTVSDIYAAAACAYDEFNRRIVSKYEKMKIKKNGDLPEYESLIQQIEAMGRPTEEPVIVEANVVSTEHVQEGK